MVTQDFGPACWERRMHSDPAEVKKTVRKYFLIGAALLVFTGITVAANLFHLAVPLAITVALIIAIIKGSMVASVFMHLNHEKKWIYGALMLTVVFFVVLLFVPFLTISDTFGTHISAPGAPAHVESGPERRD
jgi:cytochrome c oxidase subunit 4